MRGPPCRIAWDEGWRRAEMKMSTAEKMRCVWMYLDDAKSESHAWMFLMCVLSHDGPPLSSSHRLSRMRRVDSVRKDNGNESNQKTLKYHQPKRREKPPIDLSSAHFLSYLPSCAFIILSPDASKSLLRCRCWASAKDIYFDRAQTVCPVRVADRLGWPIEGFDSRSLHQIGGWWCCLQRQLPSMTFDWCRFCLRYRTFDVLWMRSSHPSDSTRKVNCSRTFHRRTIHDGTYNNRNAKNIYQAR